jgi:uncharacterized membrane protein
MEVVAVPVPGIFELILGLIIVLVGIMAWQGRLAADSTVGIRLAGTRHNPATFKAANRAAAPFATVGGIVVALGGVLTAASPKHLAGIFILGSLAVLVVCLVIGAVVGSRASP